MWCNTKGIHNTNDFCKLKVAEREKSGKPEEGKADQVKGRDKSPAGHGKQQDEDVKQVKAVYPDSDITSDDDEQAVFAKQCKAEECEGHVCSSLDSMIPTPTVQIKLKNGPYLRGAKMCEACPDTGASCNVLSEKEARRMHIKCQGSKVTLKNASGVAMRVVGETKVYAALRNGKTKHIRVIISPDLEDTMLIGWRTQKTLGMLPDTWPEVMDSEKCYKVTTEEEKEAQKGKGEGEFPIDPKFKKVLKLVEEYSDVFHDHLDESDRLCDG